MGHGSGVEFGLIVVAPDPRALELTEAMQKEMTGMRMEEAMGTITDEALKCSNRTLPLTVRCPSDGEYFGSGTHLSGTGNKRKLTGF